jgi:hypothetical protein
MGYVDGQMGQSGDASTQVTLYDTLGYALLWASHFLA